VGPAGPAGLAGAAGPSGEIGLRGPVGVVEGWTPYRYITFDQGGSTIPASEWWQVSDMASYLAENPSLQLGIDGTTNPADTDWSADGLAAERVASVRDALIRAGTPVHRIATGAFGDRNLRSDQQVEMLLTTAR